MYSGTIIGKSAEILSASDPTLVGKKGLIVYETKNMLFLVGERSKEGLAIPKRRTELQLKDSEKKVRLTQEDMLAAPEERIKN